MFHYILAAALLCGSFLVGHAQADNAWFSLNLEFNDPVDFGSGGTWTVVAKADERGFAGTVLRVNAGSLNFNPATGFIAPPQFDLRLSDLGGGGWLEVLQAFGFNPPVVDIGVIGGTFPSTYSDDPDLVLFGGNPDLGSFTGGVALATGSFDPGDVPSWYPVGQESTAANVLHSASLPAFEANVFMTVRYVNPVPEPASLLLACGSVMALAVMRRR